jgi:hypothetical protein
MSVRLDHLRSQFTEITNGINAIENSANGADLTDAQQADSDALFARAAILKPEIEIEAAKADSISATAAVLARIQPSTRPSVVTRTADIEIPTIGEVMALHLRAQSGDADATAMLQRAVATQGTTDTAGLLPTFIVGPLVKFIDARRPVFGSFTSRPLPQGGKTFTRPRVTVTTSNAQQVNEFDQPSSTKMTIVGDTVTKNTYAGMLELSEQDIDWSDPAAMQIAIQDFVDQYAVTVEGAACSFLATTASASAAWTGTNIGTMVSSITSGVSAVYTSSKRQADTIWFDLDTYLTLAGTTNSTTNVSAITLIKQALSDAGMAFNIVVGPQLAASTRIVGCSSLVESYENIKGLVSLPDLTKLGVTMAYRGYEAFFGRAEGFVKLV